MVPEETPVAFSFAGTTHAVMMASPADFEDFALGFSLTEGIIAASDEIEAIEVEDLGAGIDIQIRLRDQTNTRFQARRRRLAGPVGCGLCGIESIEEAMRSVDAVGASKLTLEADDIVGSVKLLSKVQPLHTATGAVHAAGFYIPGKGLSWRARMSAVTTRSTSWPALAQSGIDGSSGAVVVRRVFRRDGAKDGGPAFVIAVSA
jgi:FdhD protein